MRIDIPTPATTATPTLGPSLLSFPEISLDFLVTPLLAGIGVAAFVFVVGLGIFLLRR
ncbi:MAG: hypothetical protein HYU86_00025 [Chloroflexi bacterium]|nr:hypothetical protein [Chloroflexota bacterium]